EVESSPRQVTLVNAGLAPALLPDVRVTQGASEYLLHTSACAGQVPPQAQCLRDVRFKPYASGTRTGNLRIQSNDANAPVVDVALTGWGQIGALSVIPTSAYFSSQEINTIATRTLTVSNQGPGTVRVTNLSVSG